MKKKKLTAKEINQKRKLNAFSAKRSRVRKQFQSAVANKNVKQQIEAQKKINEINADEDSYRESIGKSRVDMEEERANEAIANSMEGYSDIRIDYLYYERQAIIDFVLNHRVSFYVRNKSDGYNKKLDYAKGLFKKFRVPKIPIKTFLGMAVKTDADKILSWIDKVFTGSNISSTKVISIFIEGNSVVDYLIMNE